MALRKRRRRLRVIKTGIYIALAAMTAAFLVVTVKIIPIKECIRILTNAAVENPLSYNMPVYSFVDTSDDFGISGGKIIDEMIFDEAYNHTDTETTGDALSGIEVADRKNESTSNEETETPYSEPVSEAAEGEGVMGEDTESNSAAAVMAGLTPQVTFSAEQLKDFNFLYSSFYTVDSTTSLKENLLNGETLINRDLSIQKDANVPQILILHTHSQEYFADSTEGDISTGIVGVGDYLTELLQEKGYNVIHDRTVYDYVDGVLDRNKAYTLASDAVQQILNENPTVEVVIDLHRDGISDETKHMTVEFNGEELAPVMFFNGISYTNKVGNIDYLYNPYIEDNLAMSLQMKILGEEYFPGLLRKIYIKGYRYVLHLRPRSMLIEAGFQTNTFDEVKNSMEPIAEMLEMLLNPQL